MVKKLNAIAKPAQRGHNTHNQDQSMIPHNFKTIKAIVKDPVNPNPPALLFVVLELIFISFVSY